MISIIRRSRARRSALLLAAVVPLTAAAAAAVVKAGHWHLTCSRHGIRLEARPRRNCPDCKGEGAWWSEDLYPDLCWCWDRPTRTLRLLPVRGRPDEPPF